MLLYNIIAIVTISTWKRHERNMHKRSDKWEGGFELSAGRPDDLWDRSAGLTAQRPYFPKSFAFTEKVSGIEQIFDPNVSVCVWKRGIDTRVQEYVQAGLSGTARERIERVRVDSRKFDGLLQGLPDSPGQGAFLSEMAAMVELVSTLSDCPRVGVRLLVTGDVPCPRFHVDRVVLRLICTWQGAGTEWVEHQAVDRRWLGARGKDLRDETSGLLQPGAQIHRLRIFDIGIFKGELWPGNLGRGAVHRSPRAEASNPWRVMISIEGID
jgi:hypothetical protein